MASSLGDLENGNTVGLAGNSAPEGQSRARWWEGLKDRVKVKEGRGGERMYEELVTGDEWGWVSKKGNPR